MVKNITKKSKVGLLNLGCARNLVDAQNILSNLKKQGHKIVDIENADTVIANTCCFVDDAKKESVDAILDLIELKKQGKIKKIILAGCLAQRYGTDLLSEFKEVDALIGIQKLTDDFSTETLLTPKHSAYVKICESCFNSCSFCIIPKIKGKFVSRSIESILKEINQLDEKGVKEINIIGQDITAYGMDIYKKKALAELLKEICRQVKNIKWIRLLYSYPAHITDELIDTIAKEELICKYLDIPLQHVNDQILKSMNRKLNKEKITALLKKVKRNIKDISLRSTFIVGYPGETTEQFEELYAFVKENDFDKLGVFMYSKEEGTKAYSMDKQISKAIKTSRYNKIMKLQRSISERRLGRFVGTIQKVLIDQKDETQDNIYLGRTQYDAPDVDGLVFVKSSKKLRSGDFVDVNITDSLEYDLYGEIV